ncbi:VPLPA-CTERM sorting domain-containing protein [Tropicimonas sp. TH_r6]|uniref:VPLPA-CTERM sorting domain-containing protein n=1 Tax=Tropicimonas sp. TH_r6 TaxID=3082085 RepID=UPI002955BB3D|nr:VPLPA-CTERM sorting domain-containing protein [Tropicimonas sp. TH_r6]MDV7145550.1 VPLPA-CTERM sorting domain-containing protein [Tropicimonas sp. TH_r6]
MKTFKFKHIGAAVVALFGFTGVGVADSIDPDAYSATLAVGETTTITKTVTVTAAAPTTAKVDVFFLSDTTGSMGGVINSVKTNASSILSSISGLGDVQFAVGEYKDIYDTFSYRKNTSFTSSTASAQAGINAWGASGGGDYYEANMFALESAAGDPGWRADSTRILVWFGDAPGHDPRAGSTEASATAALTGGNIIVQAVNSGNLDGTGQATRITDATGGSLFNVSGSGAGVSAAISAAITATFATYSTVDLGVTGDTSCVDVATSPGYSGSFDRSVDRDFTFTASFTGTNPGSCDFEVNALVDGGIVAVESDSITVAAIPVPAAFPMLLAALAGFGLAFRRRAV